MAERITEADCRILSKYQEAGQGAWTTMPEEDKAAYRRIHDTLDQLIQERTQLLSVLSDG